MLLLTMLQMLLLKLSLLMLLECVHRCGGSGIGSSRVAHQIEIVLPRLLVELMMVFLLLLMWLVVPHLVVAVDTVARGGQRNSRRGWSDANQALRLGVPCQGLVVLDDIAAVLPLPAAAAEVPIKSITLLSKISTFSLSNSPET